MTTFKERFAEIWRTKRAQLAELDPASIEYTIVLEEICDIGYIERFIGRDKESFDAACSKIGSETTSGSLHDLLNEYLQEQSNA